MCITFTEDYYIIIRNIIDVTTPTFLLPASESQPLIKSKKYITSGNLLFNFYKHHYSLYFRRDGKVDECLLSYIVREVLCYFEFLYTGCRWESAHATNSIDTLYLGNDFNTNVEWIHVHNYSTGGSQKLKTACTTDND